MTEVKTSKNWRSGLSVAECNRYMLKNEIHSDVTFLVGKEEKLVRAHKYVLASRSPVLDAMFYGDLAEAKKIKIPDIEPPSFDVLLRFLYCGDIALNQDTVIGVLYAADKYDVDELKKATQLFLYWGDVEVNNDTVIGALYAAEKYNLETFKKATESYLDKNITNETVFSVFANAKLFGLEALSKKCIEFMNEKGAYVFQSPFALEISKDTLKEILSSDNLDIEELKIYHFLISWGEGQCEVKGHEKSDENIRNQIGDAVYRVRFQFMDLDMFVKNVCRRNILTSEDKLILQQVIVGNLEKESTKFNFGKRKPTLKVCNVLRSGSHLESWRYFDHKRRRQDHRTVPYWKHH
ncbi:BTB/POZ domain-containing protein 6-like [Saccostrea cucullata]|uniref:BTB/POZ domain-containing protein 6-like n=1 Tax=Saccostrea cuccullata TaxID=36930 RepID=UPI002ED482F9